MFILSDDVQSETAADIKNLAANGFNQDDAFAGK